MSDPADDRIREIRAVLDRVKLDKSDLNPLDACFRIADILDSAPSGGGGEPLEPLVSTATASRRRVVHITQTPAPRVFFPGDTVPAGVSLVTKHGDLLTARATPYRIAAGPAAAYVEVPLPSLTEWQAIVDRARAEREES